MIELYKCFIRPTHHDKKTRLTHAERKLGGSVHDIVSNYDPFPLDWIEEQVAIYISQNPDHMKDALGLLSDYTKSSNKFLFRMEMVKLTL